MYILTERRDTLSYLNVFCDTAHNSQICIVKPSVIEHRLCFTDAGLLLTVHTKRSYGKRLLL